MKVKVKLAQREAENIAVHTQEIRLDAFLKLANAVESGGQAKNEIQGGKVRLNGEVCLLRGKKLHAGDEVAFGGRRLAVTEEAEE